MELKNLAQALLKAQAEMPQLFSDATNPHFRAKYPTLAAVQDVIRAPLASQGIAVLQGVHADVEAGTVIVEVTLYHVDSGESITHQLPMRPQSMDPQRVGSAITYGRRYLLMTMCGLAPEDDDGQAAGTPQRRQRAGPDELPASLDDVPEQSFDNPPPDPTTLIRRAQGELKERFIAAMRERDRDHEQSPASEAQHGYVVAVLDELIGQSGHRQILKHILGREVTGEQPESRQVADFILRHAREELSQKDAERLGRPDNPDYKPVVAETIRAIWRDVQAELGQQSLLDTPFDESPEERAAARKRAAEQAKAAKEKAPRQKMGEAA